MYGHVLATISPSKLCINSLSVFQLLICAKAPLLQCGMTIWDNVCLMPQQIKVKTKAGKVNFSLNMSIHISHVFYLYLPADTLLLESHPCVNYALLFMFNATFE